MQRFSYDLNGRRIARRYPSQLLAAPAAADSARFAYDALTGELTTVTDRVGNQFVFGYDNLLRVTSMAASGVPSETMVYDSASRLVRRTRLAAGNPADSLHYDVAGRVVQNVGNGDNTSYLAIGPVRTALLGGASDNYTVDALGNRRQG